MSAIATDVLRHIAEAERWIIQHPAMAKEMWDDSEDRAKQTERARKGETGRHAHRAQRLAAKKAEAEAAESLAVRQVWDENGEFLITVRTLPPVKPRSFGNAGLATRKSPRKSRGGLSEGSRGFDAGIGPDSDAVKTHSPFLSGPRMDVDSEAKMLADYSAIVAASKFTYIEETADLIERAQTLRRAMKLKAEATQTPQLYVRQRNMLKRVEFMLRDRQRNVER